MKILIVDDEKQLCDALEQFVIELGEYEVKKAYNGSEAIKLIKNNFFNIIFTDIRMPELSGIEVVKYVNKNKINTSIVLISGQNDIISSINAIDLGVYDFLTKPIDTNKIENIITEIENKFLEKDQFVKQTKNQNIIINDQVINKNSVISNPYAGTIIIASDKMKKIFQKLKKLSSFPDIPVLIEGKTGVGKEIVARYIHHFNSNNTAPFIGINCATFNKDIFEAELFGYDKGAFTGAAPGGKEGKINAAQDGTLFLDEITEISPDIQTKLLRVLQEKEYYKLGSNITRKVKTRLIFATNKNIMKLIKKGLFREDLYFRINVCKIIIPQLNDRKDDIIPLAVQFIKEYNEKNNTSIKEITQSAVNILLNHIWKGNVRELKNAIIKSILFNDKDILDAEDFIFLESEHRRSPVNPVLNPENIILPEKPFNLEEYNKKIIKEALKKFKGNKTKAADFLGLNRIQMYYRYKIDEKSE